MLPLFICRKYLFFILYITVTHPFYYRLTILMMLSDSSVLFHLCDCKEGEILLLLCYELILLSV